MTRTRLALVLGVVAALAVLGTVAVAVTTYVGEEAPAAEPLVVTDRGSGARLEVPGADWELRGPRSRIFYEGEDGQPIAVVTGPAVYGDGYCDEQPGDSNRGFVGFTDQAFGAWRAGLGGGRSGERVESVALADGSTATLRWVRLPGGSGPCAAAEVELAMLMTGDVRAVLVADAGEPGTLTHDEVVRILQSLRSRT